MENTTNRLYRPFNDWMYDTPASFNAMIQTIINDSLEWAFVESETAIICSHIDDVENGEEPVATVFFGDETFARFDIPFQTLVDEMIEQGVSELFEQMLKKRREKGV